MILSSISIADYLKNYATKKRKPKRRNLIKKERVVSDGEATLIQHLKAYGIGYEQDISSMKIENGELIFTLLVPKF